MARSKTWLNTRKFVDDLILQDAFRLACDSAAKEPAAAPPASPLLSQQLSRARADFQQLMKLHLARPDHPANWHRRHVEAALADPIVQQAYFRMRRTLWAWPEFATLRIATRRLLETLLELARDEALPWRMRIASRHLRPLSRMKWRHFIDAVRELEGLIITRPARRLMLGLHQSRLLPVWPARVDESRPAVDIPQWVVRHHRVCRGSQNGGWWINYDLLCQTQRVLPCFIVSLETLPKGGRQRNARMGRTRPGLDSERALTELERAYAAHGPTPGIGLRCALWQPPAD